MAKVAGLFHNSDETRQVPAGSVIFTEGESGDQMYGIIRGAIELRCEGDLIATLGPDDVFGEMALIDSSPRMASAIASADTELALIGRRHFLFLVHETPTFALQVMSAMADRLREVHAHTKPSA